MKNKKLFYVYVGVLVMLLVFGILFLNSKVSSNVIKSKTNSGTSKPVVVTKDNLDKYLEGNSIIKDMPKKGTALLYFYNNDGERKIVETYTIKGRDVTRGNTNLDNVDVEIYIDESYLSEVGRGFCSAIQKAKNDGGLSFNIKISELDLLWKYRGMVKHKDCFGI